MPRLVVSRRAFLTAVAAALPACGFGGASSPKAAEPETHAEGGHGDLAKLWAESGGDNPLKGKTFQALYNGLEAREKMFAPKDTYVRCVDEGCPGGIHMAGSGVLNPNWEADLKGKVSGVYSHEGCGAVGLYIQAQKIKTDDPNAVADAEAKKVAEKLGVPYLGRIKAADMARPPAVHTARAIYYDGTGKLDASQLAGMPQGFHITRKILSDPAYAKAELDVCIGIAMGDHGFGELFTGKTPLYVVPVSGLDPDSIPLSTLVAEIKEVAGKLDNVEVHTIVARPEAAGDPAKTVAKAANPAAAPPKSAHAEPAGHPAEKGLVPSFGPTYAIAQRVVNLADPGRFLRFSLAIEFAQQEEHKGATSGTQLALYAPEEDGAEYQQMAEGKEDPAKVFLARIKKYTPAIEDAVVTSIAHHTADELTAAEGRELLKKEIAIRVQRIVGTAERVTNVYFQDYAVQ
jgi:hypothetical protein